MTHRRKPHGALVLGVLLGACVLLLSANLWRASQPPRPDPRMVGLAVRATLFAVPSPTPRIVEVTRVVEVVVTATPLPTATATVTPTPTLSATPTEEAVSEAPPPAPSALSSAENAPEELFAADTFAALAAATSDDSLQQGAADAGNPAEAPAAPAAEKVAAIAPQPPPIAAGDCPQASDNSYTTVPIAGGGLTHPDSLHADLNLALRGYTPTDAPADLFNKDGPVDGDPPQLAGIFGDYRRPAFGPSFRVYDWDWACGEHGCRGGLVDTGASTLLTLYAGPGEALGAPHRGAQIYGGGYKALVLYAESNRITLGYTREDSVANGYAVHLENLCVDPNLLALYQSSNATGRAFLPALREDEVLGIAAAGQVLVAVRDRGVFFDPRSRLDWWHGF